MTDPVATLIALFPAKEARANPGTRVSFKALPEATGTVLWSVYGGALGVRLDGTGQVVHIAPTEVVEIPS